MTEKSNHLWHRLTGLAVLLIASVTYLLTMEPTASFWDCGEFIASSYKLEIGHPPGNPVFQIIARFFTIFTDGAHAAIAVNAMSGLCSAFTVFLLYLTTVWIARRIIRLPHEGKYPLERVIAVLGSGAVAALIFCFSDTFWFSAVEAEVYSMSSLFTALVFWAMTRWYDTADCPHAGRWIVLIAFLMGLSIGVHLLNLLTIPAIVFMSFYRIREKEGYSFKELTCIFLLSVVILAAILFGIIPWIPKLAAYSDLFFVNVLGLPFNSGAAFFMIMLLGACFYGIFLTMKKGKVLANTILLCLTVIIIGFSIFSIVIIRSSVMPPTNENKPDNPFSLVSYLNRDQYGDKPLIYGEYFGAPYELEDGEYWVRLGDRYEKMPATPEIRYASEGKMFFPRMWDGRKEEYKEFYRSYIGSGGKRVEGSSELKPTFVQNLIFFFDYQVNFMYWRYFLWNFAGRQNDIHASVPGDIFRGNWECGIPFIDHMRLGNQEDAPDYLKHNKGKNHYYMLPLLLGLIGMFFQYSKDKRGFWIVFLMFFMTGIAIVIYLNQNPYQARERDYAYAGSFYFFSAWAGLALAALSSFCEKLRNYRKRLSITVLVFLSCLFVPVQMACENWDDHDRRNRYTAVEMAANHLNTVGPHGILITHGDNDTFPLWYAQEVEGIRTDVRIINTSLYEADWHIEQMRYAANESAPLKMQVPPEQYVAGTNDFVPIFDTRDSIYPLADVMAVLRHPQAKLQLSDGSFCDYIASRRFSIPVNKDNVLKSGILDTKHADLIPDEIVLEIPSEKNYITKGELFMLDLLSNYEWDRPINLLNAGGDLNIGIKDYLMFDGFSWRFVPVKNATNRRNHDFTDPDDLYRKMTGTLRWDALSRTDWYVDYHNFYTFAGVLSQRRIFADVADVMVEAGDPDKAEEILDMCLECVPTKNFPLDIIAYGLNNESDVISLIEGYFKAGEEEKALDLAEKLTEELFRSTAFFMKFYDISPDEFERCWYCLSMTAALADEYGCVSFADNIRSRFDSMLDAV